MRDGIDTVPRYSTDTAHTASRHSNVAHRQRQENPVRGRVGLAKALEFVEQSREKEKATPVEVFRGFPLNVQLSTNQY